MEHSLNKDNPVVRLRAFRAVDDPEACNKFLEGHAYVLTSIGITKVTSSKNEWTKNPAAFVLIVESLDGERVYGGARIHVSGGSQPLPIEEATGALDSSIYDLVWKYAQYGTGELCGLWNSREIAGYGIGSIFLIRAAIAIAEQIGLQSVFALCAPYTIKPVAGCGMERELSIGNDGTFYYPKLDLLATTMILKDVAILSKADNEDRAAILKLRSEPNGIRVEELKQKRITIHYQTEIAHLSDWSLSETIANAKKNFLKNKLNENDIEFF